MKSLNFVLMPVEGQKRQILEKRVEMGGESTLISYSFRDLDFCIFHSVMGFLLSINTDN